MKSYQPNKKNQDLFKLMDRLHECKEELDYYAIKNRSSNRLNKIEDNAKEIEQLALEIQKAIQSMRRK